MADSFAVVEVWVVTVIDESAVTGARVGGIDSIEDIVGSQCSFSCFLIRLAEHSLVRAEGLTRVDKTLSK